MDVSLINEGTYPYVSGGVSTWCDRMLYAAAAPAIELLLSGEAS
ncbi:MAG: hypothetical protein QOG10_4221 [Kribbellaceae bacterium]|jgi:hypothetical protein|nr:hypothetical protein [Kribbellaceae bacterium]